MHLQVDSTRSPGRGLVVEPPAAGGHEVETLGMNTVTDAFGLGGEAVPSQQGWQGDRSQFIKVMAVHNQKFPRKAGTICKHRLTKARFKRNSGISNETRYLS